jgi:uncharacterized protein with NRDE domain
VCTAIILIDLLREYPVVVGFNRDHLYSRRGEAPRWIQAPVPYFAPVDPKSHGTWLGINAAGLIVGTVDRKYVPRCTGKRSRGKLIALALSSCGSIAELERFLLRRQLAQYAPSSLFALSSEAALLVSLGRNEEFRRLGAGCTILTEGGVDTRSRRTVEIRQRIARDKSRPESLLRAIFSSLREHVSSRRRAYTTCCHGPISGTLSSQLVMLSPSEQPTLFFYSDGSPCNTPFNCTTI